MSVPPLSFVLCGLLLSSVAPVTPVTNLASSARVGEEEHATRKPLPGPEVIAELPPDGGPEFNRLVFESSPYLRQHARNPVDWWPWGPEAFAYAEQVGKPVFLSIGYATCHWCHVMEHESFEDEEVSALMNEHFVCIKVDREERPDVDQIYMTVTQGLTQGGGWPMTVVMTPDKEPFFAGTYFPKRRRGQQPGMLELVPGLAAQWRDDREGLVQRAGELRRWLANVSRTESGPALEPATLDEAFEGLLGRQDAVNGGFGERRKFPSPSNLRFLLRYARRASAEGRSEQAEQALAMVTQQLDAMQRGGIWDHVGKGIHRYATDSRWFLPHFEKMLYDQALVSLVATETWQLTGDARWRTLAEDIYEYVLRDMTSPEGGFYSAEDADSEGEEGLFYLWRPEEIVAALGAEDGALAIELYGVEEGGNFREESNGKQTGESLLYLKQSVPDFAASRGLDPDELVARVESIRLRLFEVREPRVHPFKDDKVLTDWNGLMIASLALAGRAFDEPEYTAAAVSAADFCLAELRREDGSLMKRWRAGEAGLDGVLEDYAFLTFGLVELYQTSFEPRFLQAAVELTDHSLAHFWDEEQGGFYTASDTTTDLIVRAKESYDGAQPAGNSVSASNLVRLSRLTGNTQYEERAELVFKAFSRPVRRSPVASPWLLSALDFSFGPSFEIVVAGQPGAADVTQMLTAIARPFLPSKVVLFRPAGPDPAIAKLVPYTAAQDALEGRATAYVCENFACQAPTTDLAAVLEALGVE